MSKKRTTKASVNARLATRTRRLIGDVPPALVGFNAFMLAVVALLHPLLLVGVVVATLAVAVAWGTLDRVL